MRTFKRQHFGLAIFLMVYLGLALLYYIAGQRYGDEATIQELIQSSGAWGMLFYLGLGTLSVAFPPLNFSLTGIMGGYVYGTKIAFLVNWICKVAGSLIGFAISRLYGRRILKWFIDKDKMQAYDRFLNSETAILFYFGLSFIPFSPSDALPYLLGASALKKRVFIPVTILGTTGTAFGTAYIGSGAAFDEPLSLIVFAVLFALGMLWIHSNKKRFGLS